MDALASTFFRTNFSMPVQSSGTGTTLVFPQAVSRSINTSALGRPLTWTLRIDPASVSNNILSATASLEVRGITATSFTLEALGNLLLTRLDSQ
jgi:hypothetical protein